MILLPRIGGRYWIVTDFYETFIVIPVTVVRKGGLFDYGNGGKGLFMVRWQIVPPGYMGEIDPGYAEEYDASRRELFRTEKQAQRMADRLNGELEARRAKGEF